MDSFPVFFFYESIFLIVFPFRNVTLIQFSLESRDGRGGFITSSKVDINVLELWVRLFLNWTRRKDPFETTPLPAFRSKESSSIKNFTEPSRF